MRCAGMGGAGKHVDPVRYLVLAHRAVMRDAGEADTEPAQRQYAMEHAIGGDLMLGKAPRRLEHRRLVVLLQHIGHGRIEGAEQPVRSPPVDLRG